MQMKNFIIDDNLKKLTKHHTIALPIACYQTAIQQNIHGYIPLHWHDEIQFVSVIKGEAVFQVDEEWIAVREGDGLFINSGILHMAQDENRSGCIYTCLNLSPDFVLSPELYASYVRPYTQATNFPYFYIDAKKHWGKNIVDAISEIHQGIEQKLPYYEIDLTLNITAIWKNLITNSFQPEYVQAKTIKNDRIKQMLNWIHEHYAEKILLEYIARAGQLSQSECCRYFRRFLKSTPLNYVMDYRIQKSLQLLQGNSTITEVAYQVGFNSTSYFIQRFRESMNMTPLAYKKNRMPDEQAAFAD